MKKIDNSHMLNEYLLIYQANCALHVQQLLFCRQKSCLRSKRVLRVSFCVLQLCLPPLHRLSRQSTSCMMRTHITLKLIKAEIPSSCLWPSRKGLLFKMLLLVMVISLANLLLNATPFYLCISSWLLSFLLRKVKISLIRDEFSRGKLLWGGGNKTLNLNS